MLWLGFLLYIVCVVCFYVSGSGGAACCGWDPCFILFVLYDSRSLGVEEPHAVVEIPALYCLCCMFLGLWEWRSRMLWLRSLLYIVCVVCF